MLAETLANLMLEAAPNGAVLAFGYGAPPEGFYADSLNDAVNSFKALGLIGARVPAGMAANQLIEKQNAAFVLKKAPGDIHVYSRGIPLAIQKEGKERLESIFGVNEHGGSIAWSKRFGTAAQSRPAAEVFAGAKEKDLRSLDREHQKQREIIKQLTQETSLENRDWRPVEPQVKVGIDYNANSTTGIQVVKVDPNSPASRAGLTSGDIVYAVGPYVVAGGQQVRYRLRNGTDLNNVLRQLTAGVPVPIDVMRGNQRLRLAVVPENR